MHIDWDTTYAAIWRQARLQLKPVVSIDNVTLDSLIGIDVQKSELMVNTQRFLAGLPANNALLWGARGTGKSSLIKAILNHYKHQDLRLIEVFKNDLHNLADIVDDIRELAQKFIIYCDDFSFEENENTYVALKTVLDGSIELPPNNIILYVTSNRRHLMPEYMHENLATEYVKDEVHYADAVEEKISLSDRFGLWLSFYSPDLNEYLKIVDSYFPEYSGDREQLHTAAKQFAQKRASRSGRTARQFYNYYSQHNS